MRRNLITGGALGWAALIFLLSSQPASNLEETQELFDFLPAADFVAHVFLYFVLAALVHASLRMYLPKRKNLLALDTVIFCLLYGVSDEFHQAFVPGRTASATDLAGDVLGAVLAVTLWLAFDRVRKHRQGADAESEAERN